MAVGSHQAQGRLSPESPEGPDPTRPHSQTEGSSPQSHISSAVTPVLGKGEAGEGQKFKVSLAPPHCVSKHWKTAGHSAACLWPSTEHLSIGRVRREGQELKVSLNCVPSWRPAWAT